MTHRQNNVKRKGTLIRNNMLNHSGGILDMSPGLIYDISVMLTEVIYDTLQPMFSTCKQWFVGYFAYSVELKPDERRTDAE